MFNPKNILVTTDFTDESDTALEEAASLAEKYNSHLYLLHVLNDISPSVDEFYFNESILLAQKNRLMEAASQQMDNEINRVVKNRAIPIMKDIRFGHTIDEIIREEQEKNIDLVVAAPHRKKRAHWWNSGHIMNRLLKKSVCEIMVVK